MCYYLYNKITTLFTYYIIYSNVWKMFVVVDVIVVEIFSCFCWWWCCYGIDVVHDVAVDVVFVNVFVVIDVFVVVHDDVDVNDDVVDVVVIVIDVDDDAVFVVDVVEVRLGMHYRYISSFLLIVFGMVGVLWGTWSNHYFYPDKEGSQWTGDGFHFETGKHL